MNDPKTVLITGGQGQLATDLALTFSRHGWHVQAPDHASLDITDRTAVLDAVGALRPDAVVNPAALTNPQACENEPTRAWAIHSMAVRHLAEACRQTGAHLCQISTDYVFDGAPGNEHGEWDRPEPTSVYGRSKLGGETEVPDGHTIVRTSRLVSHHGNNVGRNVLRLARSNPNQQFSFDDHHKGCVSFTTDVAETIHTLVDGRHPGVYHVTNEGVHTWFEFVSTMLAQAGLDPGRVTALPTGAPVPTPARPEFSVLANVALPSAGVATPPPWAESLGRFIAASG